MQWLLAAVGKEKEEKAGDAECISVSECPVPTVPSTVSYRL